MSEPRALSLLRQGITAARAGETNKARRLLNESSEINPKNDTVWLWLAIVAESSEQRVNHLKRALQVNPSNKRIHQMLEQMRAKNSSTGASWKCPLCMERAEKAMNPCPNCRAVLSFRDIDAVINSEADHDKLNRAIKGYKKVLGQGVDFGAHYNLSLAHLNMGDLDKSITHLKGAILRNPNDKALMGVAADLKHRHATSQAAAALNKSAESAESSRTLILAVDDSPTIRKLVSMTLKRHEYDVALAEDGIEALSKLNTIEPDLILLDITMPRMNGYQVCRAIRNNANMSHIPVVMLSGKDGFFDKMRGRMAGTSHYLTKPFDPSILLQVVEKYALSEHQRELVSA